MHSSKSQSVISLIICLIYVTARFNQVYIRFAYYLTASCNSGFSLLSCGSDNYRYDREQDGRSIVPVDSSSCQCYDAFEAICVLWCYSGLINNFQIVKTPETGSLAGDIYAICPTGTQVLGCHPNPYYSGSNGYYPSTNTTCTCSDPYGMQCIATCASNIRNHEIITAESDGTFQVVCPPSTVALGCGMKPYANGRNNFRSAFVVNKRACQCSDNYGTACYAICGQFY